MKYITMALLAVLLGGCLKSDDLVFDNEPSVLVLINDSNWPAVVYDWSPPPVDSAFGTTTLLLRASLSSPVPAGHDVTVEFGVDPEAGEQFNAAWRASYELLPTGSYTGPLRVIIPAGKVDGSAVLTVLPETFNGLSNYILPLTISSVSDGMEIAQNKRLLLFTLQGY